MSHRLSEEDEREMLERISTTDRARAFRKSIYDRLPLDDADGVLSVGCGPGFETAALVKRVGGTGAVHGLDLNPAVLAAARERCGRACEFVRADATALPLRHGAYDLAVAVQMLQFLDDPAAALSELCRVVRPGGHVAVTTGTESGVMHTPTDLLERAREVSREAAGGRGPGTRLSSLLPAAGLVVEDVLPRAEIRTEIDDQVERGIEVRRGILERSGEFDDDEVDAWERELRALDDDGQFLSCGTKLLYVARKPETATTGPCPRERR